MPTFCTQFITDVEHTQQTGRQTHRGRQAHRQTERGTQAGRQTDQGGKAHTGATVNARFLHSIVCYVTRLLSMGDVVLGGSLLLKKIARLAKVSEPDTFKKLCMKAHIVKGGCKVGKGKRGGEGTDDDCRVRSVSSYISP